MEPLHEFLRKNAEGDLLAWSCEIAASERFETELANVEEAALALGILPARYQRNRQAISVREQHLLFRSTVAVVGCGGLGGYVIEEMARLGIGTIIAIDPDIFEEHNLNRQILATPANLGQLKVEASAERAAEINPAVTLVAIPAAYGPENGADLLGRAHVVVDALDSIPTRLALADTCSELGVPLVHGAIGGWYGQVTTQYPGDDTIQRLYSCWVEGKGVEHQLGNPSFTPALVASFQTAEVCKIILGAGEPLRNRKLVINLLDMEVEEVFLEPLQQLAVGI